MNPNVKIYNQFHFPAVLKALRFAAFNSDKWSCTDVSISVTFFELVSLSIHTHLLQKEVNGMKNIVASAIKISYFNSYQCVYNSQFL